MLAKICIHRPVLAIVLSIVLTLIGVLGYQQLEVRDMPKLFRPSLHVSVTVPGASAKTMEESVTIPLENSLQDVENLGFTASESSANASEITLHFKNISEEQFVMAQAQVQSAVSRTSLPKNADQPTIRQSGSSGDMVLLFAVQDPQMDQQHLVEYVYNHIVKNIQQLPGVGSANQLSTRDALRINLKPKKMGLLGITPSDITNALSNANINLSGGQIINNSQTISINITSKLPNLGAYRNLIIQQKGNRVIRLKDIATVAISSQTYGGAFTYYNGDQGVAIFVTSNDNANPIALGKLLRSRLAKISMSLPPGMTMHTLMDQSKLIQSSVDEVGWTILQSIALVALVTLLFLGMWRFALIPIITIPICLIANFALMWFLGFSINTLTLLALVLAIGLVIDDAIVVLENTHRSMTKGINATTATLRSMKQIVFPVLGMTISVVAVYLPVAFLKGHTAVFYQQFVFTLAGAVLISGFIALTLTPMMCSKLLVSSTGGYSLWVANLFDRLRGSYLKVLDWVIHHSWIPIILFFIFLVGGGVLFKSLPNSLFPPEYGGYIFMGIEAPSTASVDYTEPLAKQLINRVTQNKAVEAIMTYSFGGANASSAMNFIKLKPSFSDAKNTQLVAKQLGSYFKNFQLANIFSIPIDVAGHNNGNQPGSLNFYITGNSAYSQMVKSANALSAELMKSPMVQNVENNTDYTNQQYNISIDNALASRLGIGLDKINNALSIFLGGYQVNNGYEFNGVEYPIYIQLSASDLKDLNVLKSIYVTDSLNNKYSLSRLIHVKLITSLPERIHYNSIRATSMTIVPNSGYTSGQLVDFLQATAKRVLPSGMAIQFDQHTQDMLSGNYKMVLIFGLGLLFIYLVLAALFESFIDPLIILFTVPLCIVGALLVLKLLGGSLNIYTGIGLVTLIGLVSKHGVLITHFANHLKDQGHSIREAIVEASGIRLRPILMTTFTMILGAVPLILASGIGSNGRLQLGAVIIAGLIIGTFFSLFVVPIAYLIFARLKS